MTAGHDNLKALDDAVGRNAASVISLPVDGLIRHFKSRIVGECGEGLWLQLSPPAIPVIDELMAEQRPLAISFKNRQIKMSFVSAAIRIEDEFRVNDLVSVRAVLVAWPTEVRGIQRRASYRVMVPGDSPLAIRLWAIADHAVLNDRPLASQEVRAQLRDISLGGVGVFIDPPKKSSQPLMPGQRLRVELTFDDIGILLDGRLRLGPALESAELIPSAVKFQKLDDGVDGRRKAAALTRILGQLHRAEVRRAHLGVA